MFAVVGLLPLCTVYSCSDPYNTCADDNDDPNRAFKGHTSCHVDGVCGTDGCNTQAEAEACCSSTATCTAIFGANVDWWTFHGPCVLETHGNEYYTCFHPRSTQPSPPPRSEQSLGLSRHRPRQEPQQPPVASP